MVLFGKYEIDIQQLIKPIIYITIGFIIYEIVKRIIIKTEKKNFKNRHHQKRVKTINSLIVNIIRYIIIIFIIVAILANFGVNVKSIVAGLGITAAILGLAFQDIAKDFLAGISIIMEDQYEIGDTVEINEFMGEVISLGLRTTRIKNYKGQTLIIANHTISQVINYNLSNSLAVVDISVDYSYDSDKVETVLNKMAEEISGKIPKTKGKVIVQGINDLEASGVIYRVVVETSSAEHLGVQRELRKEIKKALDKANIKIPYQQIEVHNGK